MTRIKRPILALIISCLALMSAGVVVWKIPPANLWIEIGLLTLLSIGAGLALSWLTGRKKTAFILFMFLLFILISNRLEILTWITFGLIVVVLGLIGLIN